MGKDFSAQQNVYRAFEKMISGDDAAIDLVQAALLIASIEYPHLDFAYYQEQLDALAQRVLALLNASEKEASQPAHDPLTIIRAMNRVLIEEEGFHGNQADYYNPDNSFLNKVLELHTGIPVTLSLLYIVVGKRVGLQIDGVGLPFHFVTRCRLPDGVIYIDPYEGGALLSEQDCRKRLRHLASSMSGKFRLHAHWFAPVSHKQLLARVLSNLKQIYIDKEDYQHALIICDLLVLLLPFAPLEQRDRGIIHLQLKHYSYALRDLIAYTRRMPEAEDLSEIQEHIVSIRQIIAMMN